MYVDVREDTDDDDCCYEDAREENEVMRGSPHSAGCERVMSCNMEVKDGCFRRKENNPLPFPHLFHQFILLLRLISLPLLHFVSTLCYILHHRAPYLSRRLPVFFFLSSIFDLALKDYNDRVQNLEYKGRLSFHNNNRKKDDNV